MKPRDSLLVLTGFVAITTVVAFAFGAAIGGLAMGLGSAIAAFVITASVAVAARKEWNIAIALERRSITDGLIVALAIAFVVTAAAGWITGRVIVALLGILPLLALVTLRVVGGRRRGSPEP